MVSKRLFDNDDLINDSGLAFRTRIHDVITPILKEYSDCGYSLIDMRSILIDELFTGLSEMLLRKYHTRKDIIEKSLFGLWLKI